VVYNAKIKELVSFLMKVEVYNEPANILNESC
jgi:hypothetical protein